ncbi:MAG TPA: sulfite exporter TauE/SafE family protein, partial [Rubricoccaceae bacterium]
MRARLRHARLGGGDRERWAWGAHEAVFGAATAPALAVTGLFGARLRPERRLALQRVAGVLVVVMGLLTVGGERARPRPSAIPSRRRG